MKLPSTMQARANEPARAVIVRGTFAQNASQRSLLPTSPPLTSTAAIERWLLPDSSRLQQQIAARRSIKSIDMSGAQQGPETDPPPPDRADGAPGPGGSDAAYVNASRSPRSRCTP